MSEYDAAGTAMFIASDDEINKFTRVPAAELLLLNSKPPFL